MFGPYKIGFWRRLKMVPARLRLGFWPDETWSLDETIAAFVVPRLKYLKEHNHGYHGDTEEGWKAIQDEIIWALEAIISDGSWYDGYFDIPPKERCYKIQALEDRRQAGCELFGKWLQGLWD